MGFSDKGLHHIEGQNAVLGDFLVVSAMLFWAGQLTFEEKFIKKHDISPVHALGIEGKVIIKKSCREPFLWEKNTRFGLILGQLVVQWNLDLRKILGVTKIFLKSRFFLISNTRKSLITNINNSKLNNLYR